jgi:RNA polymerase sigma-70 factor (ECF subfamily)
MAFTKHRRGNPRAFARKTCSTDEALIARIAKGDQAALRALIDRHQARLSRYVLRFVSDRSLVEDVVGETFFAAWRQAASFERRSSVATWLSAIARYKALSVVERGMPTIESLNDIHAADLADSLPRPDTILEGQQMLGLLQRSLLDLPPEHATLFNLVYFHDKSLHEAESITGVPRNTIKSRMFRARKKLAVALGMTIQELGPAAGG